MPWCRGAEEREGRGHWVHVVRQGIGCDVACRAGVCDGAAIDPRGSCTGAPGGPVRLASRVQRRGGEERGVGQAGVESWRFSSREERME